MSLVVDHYKADFLFELTISGCWTSLIDVAHYYRSVARVVAIAHYRRSVCYLRGSGAASSPSDSEGVTLWPSAFIKHSSALGMLNIFEVLEVVCS